MSECVCNLACPFCLKLRAKSGMRKYRSNTIGFVRCTFNTTVLCMCCRWDSDVLHAAHGSHANELNSPLLSDRIDLALQKAVAQLLQ